MRRFGQRPQASASPFSGRQVLRMVTLATICLVAMIVFRGRGANSAGGSDAARSQNGSSGTIITAIAPSPFDELGDGVIVADGRPKQDEPPPAAGATETDENGLPTVDPRLVRNVLDKTAGFPLKAYFHLLTCAARAEPDLLAKHASRTTGFEQLWNEPESHRGKLIFLDGHLQTLAAVASPEGDLEDNPIGITTVYEASLITAESHPNPYIIIVPSISHGMPLGTNISEHVTFAGYFLKLKRYTSVVKNERAAPLLIGRLVTWTPVPRSAGNSKLSIYLAASFVVLLVTMAGVLWVLSRGSRRRRASFEFGGHVPDADTDARAKLAELERFDVVSPIDELQNRDKPPEV